MLLPSDYLLFFINNLPIFTIIYLLFFVGENEIDTLRNTSLVFSFMSCFIVDQLYRALTSYNGFYFNSSTSPLSILTNVIGVDGFSIYLIYLTSILLVLCILYSRSVDFRPKYFYITLFLIQYCVNNAFTALNLLSFYIYFEAVIFPMFALMVLWGSRSRKIYAAHFLYLLTYFCSLLRLLSILYLYYRFGTVEYEELLSLVGTLTPTVKRILWVSFFLSVMVKVPIFPCHLWLTEAHAEAPTVGSVILAGILLKLGVYAYLRFCVFLFPDITDNYKIFVYTICTIGLLYTCSAVLRQLDIKRIIAYSSIGHRNFVILASTTHSYAGISSARFTSLSHGFISSGLFFLFGRLYDRYKTRNILDYGGLAMYRPLWSFCWAFRHLSNAGLPFTSAFPGETISLLAILTDDYLIGFVSYIGAILATVYSILIISRICFGPVNSTRIAYFDDLTIEETIINFFLLACVFLFGIRPNTLLDVINDTTAFWLNR